MRSIERVERSIERERSMERVVRSSVRALRSCVMRVRSLPDGLVRIDLPERVPERRSVFVVVFRSRILRWVLVPVRGAVVVEVFVRGR